MSLHARVAGLKKISRLVPGERIELPTNGLQNRCSTAELTRLPGENSYVSKTFASMGHASPMALTVLAGTLIRADAFPARFIGWSPKI
jgi:hypothetical protein